MATPTASGTLRPDLAEFHEFDIESLNQGYIGLEVLPEVSVSLQSDNPGKIPLRELLREMDDTRTDRGTYNRFSMKFDRWSYATQEHGVEYTIDDREEARYQHVIGGVDRIGAKVASSIVARNLEKRIAAKVFDTATWTGADLTTNVATSWGLANSATCKPIDDVETAVRKVFNNSALKANALIISWFTFRNLRLCTQILDRIAANGAGREIKASDVTAEMLAQVFDLEKVIVAGGVKNGAVQEVKAKPEMIWSNSMAMVCRVSSNSNMRDPSLGRVFHWTEDGSQIGGAIEEYESSEVRGRVIRVRNDVDETLMYKEAGHLLTNVG